MSLKLILETLEGLSEHLKPLYEKTDDGKFKLTIEGLEDIDGLKRSKDTILDEKKKLQVQKKELEDKLKAFDGINPEDAKAALETNTKLKEKKLIEEGQIDEVVNQRLKSMKQEHENQLKHLTERADGAEKERETLRESLHKAIIDKGLAEAINSVGVPKKEALKDIFNRGRGAWKIDENGSPVAYDEKGNVLFSKDAKNNMTMNEWAEMLTKDAPHLFEETRGGGSKGNLSGRASNLTPEQLKDLNPMQKMMLGREQNKKVF